MLAACGATATSDTIAWQQVTTGLEGMDIQGAAQGHGWVLVADHGGIAWSPDALTWTRQPSHFRGDVKGAAWGRDRFLAVGEDPAARTVAWSPDGQTWTAATTASSATMRGVGYGDGAWIAAGDGVIQRSADGGQTWTDVSPPGTGYALWTGVAYARGTWVVVSGRVPVDELVATSPTGQAGTWTVRPITDGSPAHALDDVVFDGERFVVPTHPTSRVFTSPDALHWTERTTGAPEGGLWEVAAGPGVMVGVGHAGSVVTSFDGGATWSQDGPDTGGAWLSAVEYADGTILVGGEGGRAWVGRVP